jgi:DNA (cytosine-5)-methyltransferase 1
MRERWTAGRSHGYLELCVPTLVTVGMMQRDLFDYLLDTPEPCFADFCDALGVKDGPRWADRFGEALRAWAEEAVREPVRTLSLFSGVGGLDIAFHDAGFKVKTAVEIEERFVATLRANAVPGGYLDGTEVLCLDVRDYHPEPGLKIDFVLGGPPCQSFSAAGRRAAGVKGTQDERGTLFQEYVRLLKVLKPRGFLFENVYGITGAEGGKAWDTIRRAFKEAGFSISFRILDAADYGVPQHRERMFIVGVRDAEFLFPAPTHGPDSPDGRPFVSAAAAIEGAGATEAERAATVRGRFGPLLNEIPPGLNYSFFTEKMGHPRPIFAWRSKFSDFLYKADPGAPIRTLKAQGGSTRGPSTGRTAPSPWPNSSGCSPSPTSTRSSGVARRPSTRSATACRPSWPACWRSPSWSRFSALPSPPNCRCSAPANSWGSAGGSVA